METLTKENFWNRIRETYPEAFKVFGWWVNKYKIDNNWIELFNNGTFKSEKGIYPNPHKVEAPKYHDLPVALQWGIFTQFIYETIPSVPNALQGSSRMTLDCEDYIQEVTIVIEDFLRWLNRSIVDGKAG